MFRFDGFEFDPDSARLRSPAGDVIRLRPKSFEMLQLLIANAGRAVSKSDIMAAIWPNVHVGDDSLFQCIREIRTALGDERRELVKLVSGRGYMLDTEVATVANGHRPGPAETSDHADPIIAAVPAALASELQSTGATLPPRARWSFDSRRLIALGFVACLGAIVGIAIAAPLLSTAQVVSSTAPTLVVMPIIAGEPDSTAMAAHVTRELADGLAKIERIRVLTPEAPQTVAAKPGQTELLVSGELRRQEQSWTMTTRLINRATGEVRWTNTASVGADDGDQSLQQSRLTAAAGYHLAQRLNAIVNSTVGQNSERDQTNAKVAIDQAKASINQTTPERFRTAQVMLEKALADDSDNADLKVALAVHMLRGIQLVWYDRAEAPAIEKTAQTMLEQALRTNPTYLPVLDGYCRLLTATNQFVDSLVACGKTLSFNPWNGQALYNLGLSQLQLGRFADALASFQEADNHDTPDFSRWTWMLGAGIACLAMDRNEEAITWLKRSIAVTVGTGRTHAVLAAAYQRLGRTEEARTAMAKALELRPGTTTANIGLSKKNASQIYIDATQRLLRSQIAAGLPES